MKGPNPIIGTVPCPIGGCKDFCPVRKFRDQAGAALGRRRKAGKFYFDCPTHGRFGFDGNPAMQEHVLESITWSDESARAAAGARAPASSTTAASPSSPASSGASPARSPSSRPVTKPAGSTSSGTQTRSQTQTAPASKGSWREALEDLL